MCQSVSKSIDYQLTMSPDHRQHSASAVALLCRVISVKLQTRPGGLVRALAAIVWAQGEAVSNEVKALAAVVWAAG